MNEAMLAAANGPENYIGFGGGLIGMIIIAVMLLRGKR